MTDFDTKARTWDADPAKAARAERVAQAIRAQVALEPGMTLLEFGCGTGLLGFALLRSVRHVTFADSSREMLAVVREKIAAAGATNATVLPIDPAADVPPGARYDLVCTLMTLHHVPDTDRLLRTFHGLLVPGGYVCAADLDREDGAFHGPGFDGHNGFDRGELAGRLERAGFADVRFVTACEIEKQTGEGLRRFPVFLATAKRV
jgi:2-polyprenyl-3-methyl-5-hydroxy-6-metoxy-1,4-benzoquinol methylase